jgi:MFS family permease
VDLSPLRHRDFRLFYFGQFVSFFGSMMSYVALPFVLYQATKSTLWTGALGVIQLVPSVVGALLGGALADAVDRRKLIVICESGMALIVLALGIRLTQLAPLYPHPLWILAAGAGLSILNGFHRPALEALGPRLVEQQEIPALGVLSSLRGNVGMIGGPAVAGILISAGGAATAFYLDAASFVLCIVALLAMEHVPTVERSASFSLAAVEEGFRYAFSRPDLIGTYVVDVIAMTFSMPNLLFPAVAEALGSSAYLGWLHSGISIGALCATLMSRFFLKTRRHGAMILLAAGAWSLCMIGFGLSHSGLRRHGQRRVPADDLESNDSGRVARSARGNRDDFVPERSHVGEHAARCARERVGHSARDHLVERDRRRGRDRLCTRVAGLSSLPRARARRKPGARGGRVCRGCDRSVCGERGRALTARPWGVKPRAPIEP